MLAEHRTLMNWDMSEMKAYQYLYDHPAQVHQAGLLQPIAAPTASCTELHQSDATQVTNKDSVSREEYLTNVSNNLPIAVVTLNNEGYVEYCNEKALNIFGATIIGQLWRKVIELYVVAGPNDDEVVLRDGRILYLETCPLADKKGQILTFNDITRASDLKNIRNQHLRLAELGEMAAALAHQIRTPLAASMLFFSNIKKTLNKSSQSYSSLEKGLYELKHIGAMVEDMLMFSKDGKKGDDKLTTKELVADLIFNADSLMQEYGCEIIVADKAKDKEIILNRHGIKSAISNILVNSAQACKARQNNSAEEYKPIIKIEVNDYKYSLMITVEDNGIGVEDDYINHIKEPFFTTKTNGTGLGLSVAKSVIESHGGVLDIRSSINEWTIVKIFL